MRIGVSLKSTYSVGDPRTGAHHMIERAAAARDANLDSLFVGDHHATGPFAYYQNVAIMGRLLAEWSDAPAGVLMLLPLWHPVLAAEQLGTLAAVARGRFVLQCAVGGGAEQFAAMGVPLRERKARFEQGLDILRRLLAGEEVTSTDGPYRVEGARIAPVPAEPLEVWIGATAPAAIDRAARLGDGWMANAPLVPDEAAEQAARYLARCEAHGRAPGVVAIRRDVHVGADHDDAERVAGAVVDAGYRGFRPAACTYGSVDEVGEQLATYATMGYTDVIVRLLAEEHTEVLASLERLGSVREALRDA
ncbi:MAG: LLM class flavin-dependent oxidoreductase [Acidimicrobiia bacterium]|jgi:alkanesulfonate monooxygenase SsuD/methylene tetrahydromethanopterin reductase-like flavin-dependent oxidoreductase (luciferase family)|nr:LLM class flavin-dependent oxidoreductase [Acidimicrobiia bacterium]